MVILLQLCLFFVAAMLRGRYLFGSHLAESNQYKSGLTYISTHRGGITARHIGLKRNGNLAFIIKPERWYHRLLKNIGIASEVGISDSDFNKRYFITTDYPAHLEQLLASGTLLTNLRSLFELPIKSLHVTHGKIWCVIRKGDLEESDAHYTAHFNLLSKIADAIKILGKEQSGAVSSRLEITAIAFLCIHAGLLLVGIIGFPTTLADSIDIIDTRAWIITSAAIGATGAAIWFFALIRVFRNSSWICWVFADFLLCGIAGFMLSSIMLTREANIYFVQEAPHIYEQTIIQKSCALECRKRCGKRCTRYSSYPLNEAHCDSQLRPIFRKQKQQEDYVCAANAWYTYELSVPHWNGGSVYSFATEPSLFDTVASGTVLGVPVNRGALGLEWVDIETIQQR